MKRCNQCGTIVKDEARFCPNCGMSYFSSFDNDQTVSLNHENGQKAEDGHKETDEQKTVYHGKAAYEKSQEADKRYEYESGDDNAWTQQNTGEQRDHADRYGTFSGQRQTGGSQNAYGGQTSSGNSKSADNQQAAYGGGHYSNQSAYSGQEPKKRNGRWIVLCILAAVVLVWAILVLLLVTDTGEVRFLGFLSGEPEISETEMLDGTWSGNMDITELVYQSLLEEDEEMAPYFENVSLVLPISFTFYYNAEGSSTCEMHTDEDIAYQIVEEWVLEGTEAYLSDILQQNGLDMTVEEYFALTGYSWEQAMEDGNMYAVIESYLESMVISGYYTASDGVIYILQTEDVSISNYDSIEVYELTDDNKLILYGAGEDDYAGLYPITLYGQSE